MTLTRLALAAALLAGICSVTASHAQEPTGTPGPTETAAATGTAVPATATSEPSPAASPTPFNTPPPGELIAPAPQPTSQSVIAPQTGFGEAEGNRAQPWMGLAVIGVLGVIAGTAGIAARFAAARERNR